MHYNVYGVEAKDLDSSAYYKTLCKNASRLTAHATVNAIAIYTLC